MIRSWLAAAALLAAVLAPAPPPAKASDADRCGPGGPPQFVFGFADLKSRLGDAMGDPATCEFPDPSGSGDIHQGTTTGLAFWRKSTNTPTFTNGSDHWALTPDGLVAWTGDTVDPPGSPPSPTPSPVPTPQVPTWSKYGYTIKADPVAFGPAFELLHAKGFDWVLDELARERTGVVLGDLTDNELGYYDAARDAVVLLQTVAGESAEVKAALIAHEALHSREYGLGPTGFGPPCYLEELRAYTAQTDVLRAVWGTVVGRTPRTEIERQQLAWLADSLAGNLETSVRTYATNCAG